MLNLTTAVIAPNQIIYYQAATSGSPNNASYVEYDPATGPVIKQFLSGGTASASGTVSNPAPPSGSPALLPITASYYASGYTGSSAAANVGTSDASSVVQTGVCSVSPNYTIQPKEGLVFSLGTNTTLAGQVFSRASIPLKNESSKTAVSGNFVLRMNGTTVGTVPFTAPAGESSGDTSDCGPFVTNPGGVASPSSTSSRCRSPRPEERSP